MFFYSYVCISLIPEDSKCLKILSFWNEKICPSVFSFDFSFTFWNIMKYVLYRTLHTIVYKSFIALNTSIWSWRMSGPGLQYAYTFGKTGDLVAILCRRFWWHNIVQWKPLFIKSLGKFTSLYLQFLSSNRQCLGH